MLPVNKPNIFLAKAILPLLEPRQWKSFGTPWDLAAFN